MRSVLPVKIALASLVFAACVTINVYFPAAAAEKAADQIIDQVTGSPASAPSEGAPRNDKAPPPTSHAPAPQPPLLLAAGHLLEMLVPAAHAQADANLDISTPEIRQITASMASRFDQLEKYFASGAVGLTSNGLVEVRDAAAIPLAERALVKRLVAEDNQDRNTLYAEIARANGHPEWEPDIRKIFARRWVERGAKPGWYYQDSGGGWVQK
jgi:uncharacterized protein YdbL (DUF1318 family)